MKKYFYLFFIINNLYSSNQKAAINQRPDSHIIDMERINRPLLNSRFQDKETQAVVQDDDCIISICSYTALLACGLIAAKFFNCIKYKED